MMPAITFAALLAVSVAASSAAARADQSSSTSPYRTAGQPQQIQPVSPVGPAGAAAAGQLPAQGIITPAAAASSGFRANQSMLEPTEPVKVAGASTAGDRWTAYRYFRFEGGRVDFLPVDRGLIAEIATHLERNPALDVALDGSTDPRLHDISEGRVNAVRYALKQAGVPDNRIRRLSMNDPQFPHDGRVEVLFVGR